MFYSLPVEFAPHGAAEMYHHMSFALCKSPGSLEPFWDCGETHFGSRQWSMPAVPACFGDGSPEDMLFTYTWTAKQRNASLIMPRGTGQPVGQGTGYNYIVMVTHFPVKANLTNGMSFPTGSTVRLSVGERLKPVGIFYFMILGSLPPHSVTSLTGTMTWQEEVGIHLFAATTHSHSMGVWFRVEFMPKGGNVSEVIIDRDPSLDQRFIPMTEQIVMPGDRITMKCTYNNSEDTVVQVR
jgi:hypothetical protein